MSVVLNTAGWGTPEQRKQLLERLTFSIQPDPRYAAKTIEAYSILKDKRSFVCPFAVGQLDEYKHLRVGNNVSSSWAQPESESSIAAPSKRKVKSTSRPVVLPEPVFHGMLYPNQMSIHAEMWAHVIAQSNVLLHVNTGGGKSMIAVHLAYRLYMELHPSGPRKSINVDAKTVSHPAVPTTCEPASPAEMQSNYTDPFVVMLVVHRSEILKQWVQTIHERLPGSASVQVLDRKCPVQPTPYPIKFVIINTVNIDHRWSPDKPFHCSLLILDEAHTCVTDNAIFRLLSIRPTYVLALTATPDRTDGRSAALNMVAAPRVVRKMRRLFHVYHHQTNWRCRTTTHPATGELDWNAILEAQATHQRRNRLIAEFVLLFWRAERTVMVLCKRIDQVMLLQQQLEQVRGTFVPSEALVGSTGLTSNQRPGEERPRVLLTTYSLCGVGFSDARLDTLIIAGDVEEMALQYAGRIFRRPDVSPIIVDVVDPHVPGMKKHFRSRCAVYSDMGGVIEPFDQAHDCSLLPIDLKWA